MIIIYFFKYIPSKCSNNLFSVIDLWLEEAPYKQCKGRKVLNTKVNNQKECQENCVQYVNCIGIVYSHISDFMDKCGVCEKDALEDATDGYGFYRKPGNVQEYALRFVYTSRSNYYYKT